MKPASFIRYATGVVLAVLIAAGSVSAQTLPPLDIAYLYGTPYSLDGQWGSPHFTVNLNDGRYGNSYSWIPSFGSVAPWEAGITLPVPFRIDAVAFGRDNTGSYTDRQAKDFTIESSVGGGPFGTQRTVTGRTTPTRVQYDFFRTGTPGIDQVFIADNVRITTTATTSGTHVCIDELELYGRPVNVPDGRAPFSNLAQRPEADPFASSVLGGYPDRHTIAGLTDGVYGNMNSWIPASAGTEYFGVSLGRLVQVRSIAFGRDNTDVSTDRVAPSYTLQYTTAQTNNYNDPTIAWTTLATVDRNYAPGGGTVRPAFAGRMQYDLATPVEARAVRVVVSGTQVAIDELEVLGVAPPSDNLATRGTAYASSALPGYPIHQIVHLNDGMYGNTHSWISNETNAGIAGIALDAAYRIDAVAFGRDNGGEPTAYTDRQARDFTIRSSVGGGPFTVRQTVTGRTTPTRVQYDFINGSGEGQISTWVADRVQVNITSVNGGREPCIDELEVYGRPSSVAGYNLATNSGNLARRPGATAIASSVIPGYPDRHTIAGLTDGVYGNMNSWIPASSGSEYGGVHFGGTAPVVVNTVAFGRDNTDYYKDRVASSYTIEYTLDDPADPNARWLTRRTVDRNYAPGGGTVRPLFSGRMEYDVGQMPARGVRIAFSGTQACIDELETIGFAPMPNVSFQYLKGSTAAASSEHSSGLFSAAHLNDRIQGTSSGSPARYWNDNTNGVAGDWARLTWGDTQQIRFVNLRMPLTNYDLPTSTLPGVKVQYLRPGGNPDNHADWLDYDAARTLIAPNAAGSNPNPNNWYDHAPIITRGVRAYFTSSGNDDGWNFLEEIEAYGSPNIARLVGTAWSSSQHSSGNYPTSALNDGVQAISGGGYWNDGTQGTYPDYAGILFKTAFWVDGVNLRTPVMVGYDAGVRAIDDVSIQYLVPGGDPNSPSDWQTLIGPVTLVAPLVNDGSQNDFFSFSPLLVEGIRAYFGPGSGNNSGWNYLDEIEVFGLVPEPGSAVLALFGGAALAVLLGRFGRKR